MVSDGTMVAGQMRYQLTLMLRTPRTLMAGLILPGALLALQLGRVQHLGQGAARAIEHDTRANHDDAQPELLRGRSLRLPGPGRVG